jgi:phenylacetyl-CoA:acceptor oxidoreductase
MTISSHRAKRTRFIKPSAALKAVGIIRDKLFGSHVKILTAKAASEEVARDAWIPFCCNQCGMGPCPARAHVVNGVLLKVEGNPDFREKWPCPSLVCGISNGIVQKLYNPYRLKEPMKRTNPKKGLDEDPKFVEISWDEAFDILTNKLKEVREKGLVDEHGLPRVVAADGSPATVSVRGHGWVPFWVAWGPVDKFCSGETVKCFLTIHVLGEFWHRCFSAAADYRWCNYLILLGRNAAQNTVRGATSLYAGYADAKSRGMKLVFVCPILNATGASADEWIPIKPKTDAAFLFAMIHVILHEMDWRKVCDIEFLKKMTNSPYLVGPHGYYVRDPATKKPLVWDPSVPGAKAVHEAQDFALEGTYAVKGMENGPDEETYFADKGTPSFQQLIEHVKDYTPEWASTISDVPAETIRRIAREWVEHAMVGATIRVDGVELPFRPVAIDIGRGLNNGWGAQQCTWAQHVLQILVGALNVPGSFLRARSRLLLDLPIVPDDDGFLLSHVHPTDKEHWEWPPKSREGLRTLTPLSGPQDPAGAMHFAWKSFTEPVEKWPASVPDVYILYRSNPVSSQYDSNLMRKAFERIPFIVNFAFTINESNWFADLLLPESTESESYQLHGVTSKETVANVGNESVGYLIRQPLVKPLFNTRDLTDIFTELADRLGMLPEYNSKLNTMNKLEGPLELSPAKKYSVEEIVDRLCKSVTKGEHGLEWFKESGGILWPISKVKWYFHNDMIEHGIRYQLPYQERLKIVGEQLKRRLHEVGIEWWDSQADGLAQPLPGWKDFRAIYEDVYKAGPEYDLWVMSHRSSVFAGQQNFGVPWMLEAAKDFLDAPAVLINSKTAKKKGIKSGDRVCLESVFGKTYADAVVSETVRPDVVSVYGAGNYITPISKELGWANTSELQRIDVRLIDEVGGSSDHTIVKIYKV